MRKTRPLPADLEELGKRKFYQHAMSLPLSLDSIQFSFMKAVCGLLVCSALLSTAISQEVPCILQVTAAEAGRHLIKNPRPSYPPLAKQARIQGTVVLRVNISPTGKVSSVKMVSGHPILAQAAKDAVQQWEYSPFRQNGQSCSAYAPVEVPFKLDASTIKPAQ
jgi:TonB family protein